MPDTKDSIRERLPEDLLDKLRRSTTYLDSSELGCMVKGVPACKIRYMASILQNDLYFEENLCSEPAHHGMDGTTILIVAGVAIIIVSLLVASVRF